MLAQHVLLIIANICMVFRKKGVCISRTTHNFTEVRYQDLEDFPKNCNLIFDFLFTISTNLNGLKILNIPPYITSTICSYIFSLKKKANMCARINMIESRGV